MLTIETTRAHGFHYSRYIVSWLKERGKLIEGDFVECDDDELCGYFAKWLKIIGVDEDEIKDICSVATWGNVQLEASAKMFIRKNGI